MEKNDNAPKVKAKIKIVPVKKIDGTEEKLGKNLFEIFADIEKEDLKIIVRSLELVERASIYIKHGQDLDECKKISNEQNYNMAIYTLETLVFNYKQTLYDTLNISKEELIKKLEELTLEEKQIIYKAHGKDLNKTMPAEKIFDKPTLRKYTRLLSKINSKSTRRKINESKTDKVEEEVIKVTEQKIEQKNEQMVKNGMNVARINFSHATLEEKQQCLNEEILNVTLKELYQKLNIVFLKFIVEIQPMYLREIIYDTYGNDLDKIVIDFSTMNHQELNLLKEALYNIDKLVKLYSGIEEEYKINNTDNKIVTKNNNKKKKKKKNNIPQMLEGQLETFRLTFLEKYNNIYGNCLSENEINNIIVESILYFDKDDGLNIILSCEYKINNRILKVLSDKYKENIDNEKGMEIMMTIIDIYTSKFKQKYPYLSDNIIEKTIEECFENYDGSKTFNITTEIKLKKIK